MNKILIIVLSAFLCSSLNAALQGNIVVAKKITSGGGGTQAEQHMGPSYPPLSSTEKKDKAAEAAKAEKADKSEKAGKAGKAPHKKPTKKGKK
jgi:hypothetical protein